MFNKAPVIAESITSQSGKPVTVNDSADMPLQGMKLYGKSTQVTTSGKNLAEPVLDSKTYNGITIAKNKDGSYSVKGTALQSLYLELAHISVEIGKQYTISGGVGGELEPLQYQTYLVYPDYRELEYELTQSTIVAERDLIYYMLAIYVGATVDLTIHPMCNEGSTALPYEPYTGGKQSPSPEYPQEIESIGNIGVKVTGKNLFDIKRWKDNSIEATRGTIQFTETGLKLTATGDDAYTYAFGRYYVIEVKPNTRYTLLWKSETNVNGDVYVFKYKKDSSEYENFITNKTELQYLVFDTDEWCDFITFRLGVANTGNTINYENVALYEGDYTNQVNSYAYEPYKESKATIPLPNGLPGIPVESNGNYTDETGQQYICDEIDFERGKYIRRIGVAILDGSESPSAIGAQDSPELFYISGVYAKDWYGLCNQYNVVRTLDDFGININSVYNVIYFANSPYFDKTKDDRGASKLLESFQRNNFKAIYVLKTPIETDITQSQLQSYKSLQTFKPNSIISNDAGAQMDVDYAADTKTWITNKITTLINEATV